jgi:hypothetical protein
MEMAAFDLEIIGSAGDVPVMFSKLPADIFALECVPCIPQGIVIFHGQQSAAGRHR